MKLTFFTFFTALALMSCESSDNDPDQYLISTDAVIKIENNETDFSVGETIFIETNILNQQTTDDGQEILLSDFIAQGISPNSYSYSLAMFKIDVNENLSRVTLTEDIIEIIEGEAEINNGHLIIKSFLKESAFYSKIGIKLSQPGTNLLSSKFYESNPEEDTIIISSGSPELGYVGIKTYLSNIEGENAYKFKVTN